MRKLASLGLAAVAALAIGCQDKVASVQQTQFFDRGAMDSAVAPGDNFFEFANGSWLRKASIPDDYSGWGSFNTLYDENLHKLHALLEGLGKKEQAAGSLEQKAGDFFASGMDTATIDKAGATPLKPWIAKIDAARSVQELLDLGAQGFAQGAGEFYGWYVSADEKNSSRYIPILYQAMLTLPEKGYYTRTDAASQEARSKVTGMATRYFELLGMDKAAAAAAAQQVLAIETKIATTHRAPEELRDPSANYNKMAVADLDKQMPNLGWTRRLALIGIKTDSVNVAQPGYYKGLNALTASESLEAWKAKMKFDYINDNIAYLAKPFRDAQFELSKVLSGAKKQPDRWKEMVDLSDNSLQDVVGQLYVKAYFPPEAKLRMDTLVNNLAVAFRARIEKLSWMSDSTKQKAIAKLGTFLKKIGYPEKWKDFSDVTIKRDDFFGNHLSVVNHFYKERIGKIGRPVDRTEWGMTPSTVNAYYNPTYNEIVFPAGILQFPFFHPGADDAVNYGGIGMVIGHEMTHGFDDQGAQYDAVGNMANWWLPADEKQFKEKGAAMAGQYSAYTMFDSMHVNGKLTLGENLADLGGLAIAWDAFKMTHQGKDTARIDGLTPDERFFLGFAQIWRLKTRDESMKTRLNTDPHSPEVYRVNGPLSNFDPFYATFQVKEGNKMFRKPEERVRVW
ncbi:MAG: M13 family peptidase [Chitinophagaceae bacterium]|nr:MAG: M13 family peptidase [Chitinophagaceae bacterium]